MWENVCASAFWLLVLAQFAAVLVGSGYSFAQEGETSCTSPMSEFDKPFLDASGNALALLYAAPAIGRVDPE